MYLIKLQYQKLCVHMDICITLDLKTLCIGLFRWHIKKLFTVSDDESEDEHVRVTKKLKGSKEF